MKRLSFSKIAMILACITLLMFGLFHGVKSIAMVYQKALVPVYLVNVKPESAKTYDENGFFIGQFVGEFDYQGHRFEQNISISQRFDLIKGKKPVRHIKLLSAAEIGIDTPFSGPITTLLYLLVTGAFFLSFVFFSLPNFAQANKKAILHENKACS